MTVYSNKLFGSFVFKEVANATYIVAGNTSTSNVALGVENVQLGSIYSVAWGVSGTGTWTVKRDAVTILVLSGTGAFNDNNCDLPLDIKSSANVSVELSGGTGSIIVGLRKYGNNFNSSY